MPFSRWHVLQEDKCHIGWHSFTTTNRFFDISNTVNCFCCSIKLRLKAYNWYLVGTNKYIDTTIYTIFFVMFQVSANVSQLTGYIFWILGFIFTDILFHTFHTFWSISLEIWVQNVQKFQSSVNKLNEIGYIETP